MGTARGRSCAAAHLSHYPSQDPSQYPGDAGARHSSTHLCCQLKFRRQSVFRSRRGKRHHITWREIRGGVERSTRKCSAFKKQNKKVTRRRARARTCSFTCCTAPRSDTDTASESAGCALAARRQGAGRRFEDGHGARGANLRERERERARERERERGREREREREGGRGAGRKSAAPARPHALAHPGGPPASGRLRVVPASIRLRVFQTSLLASELSARFPQPPSLQFRSPLPLPALQIVQARKAQPS